MNFDSRNVLSDKAHTEELLKPFVPSDFKIDLQLFGGGGGKDGGKMVASVLGFAIGFAFPAAFGMSNAWGTAALTAGHIAGGVLGASLFSSVWTAVKGAGETTDNNSSVNIQRFDREQESMSYGGSIPVVYGLRKISGNQTYHETDATAQKLHKHVVLCEGGVEGIQSVSANDLLIPTGTQSSNTVFTLQNVKYEDATVSLSGKTLTLHCNGKSKSIRLINKADVEASQGNQTYWQWQTNVGTLVSYINRLGDGWQAFPTATTSNYPGDMSVTLPSQEVSKGEVRFPKSYGEGDNCQLPNQKYQIGYGGNWRDAGVVGVDPAPAREVPYTDSEGRTKYSHRNIRTVNIARARRGKFLRSEKENYISGYKNIRTGAVISVAQYNSLGGSSAWKPVYDSRTLYVYEDFWTQASHNVYKKTADFTCATVIGGTKYQFHDCEAPDIYEKCGGYPQLAWLDMHFVISDELNGNPTVSVIMKGKKVLDMRTGKTEYSTNPAWCLRDFILSKRYGLGRYFRDEDIDADSWCKAADYCDEIIEFTNSDGSREQAKRYELNMVIDARRSAIEWLQEMLANFCGYLVFSEGKLKLKIERQERVSYKFNDDSCFGLSVAPLKLSETPNKYSVKFVDPMNNWTSVMALCEDYADQKIRQKIVEKEVSLEGVTSQHQALRLARFYRDYNLVCPLNVSFTTGQQAMHLEPGDVVTISYHGVFKELPIRISEIRETEKGTFEIQGRQYNDTIYTDELGGGVHWYSYATEDSPLTGEVPPPLSLRLAETGYESNGGIWINSVTAKWNSPAYSFIDHYEVSYSYDNANYVYAGTTKENSFIVPNTLSTGRIYVRVETVNTANRRSAGATAILDLQGKNIPPEEITEFVVGQYNSEMDFILQGKVPDSADFDKVELRLDGSDWQTATPTCFFEDFPYRLRNVDLAAGEHIFRVKSVDSQGHRSEKETVYQLDVRNVNQFKNILLDRDDIQTRDYTLTGLTISENGNIIDPWNTTFEDIWNTDFDKYWYNRLDSVANTKENEPLNMWGLDFSDVWDDTFDGETVFDSYFRAQDKEPEVLSSVIDTYHIGLTGVNYIFNLSASLQNPCFEDIWEKTFDDYWGDTIDRIHSDTKIKIYIRFSKDKETWTEWQPYLSATYDFRYVQYKVVFEGMTDNVKVDISKLQQFYDVPDIVFTHSGETVEGYAHVDFDTEYYEVPEQISCTIIGTPAHVVVQNVTTKGCDIYTYNDGNTPISTRYSLTVRGW